MEQHGDNHHAPAGNQYAPRGGRQQQQRLRASHVDGSGELPVEDIHGDENVAGFPAEIADRFGAPARNAPAGSEPVSVAPQGTATGQRATLVVITPMGYLLPFPALEHPPPPRHPLNNAQVADGGAAISSDSGDDGLLPMPTRPEHEVDNTNESSNISTVDDGDNREEDDNYDMNPNAAVLEPAADGASRPNPTLNPPVWTSNPQDTHDGQVPPGAALPGPDPPLSPPRGRRAARPEVADEDHRTFPVPRSPPSPRVSERRRTQNRIAQRTFRQRQRNKLAKYKKDKEMLQMEVHDLEKKNAVLKRENELLRGFLEQSGCPPPRNLLG